MLRMLRLTAALLMVFGVICITAVPLDPINECDSSSNCKLPDCVCMSTNNPLGLSPNEIPQLVILTFDDAVKDARKVIYDQILDNRVNPNGCPATMTFFVNHDTTDYQMVNSYYNKRFEIAGHSVTHKDNNTYWKSGDKEQWMREVGQQRDILSYYANIPKDDIVGFRSPYLQTSGDRTYEALKGLNVTFDSSLPTNYRSPPIWPFTLDYGVTHDCIIPPCTTGQYSGVWTIPMVQFESQNGNLCGLADGCFQTASREETFDYFQSNFLRHVETRAPFGIHQHATWFINSQDILNGFIDFLDWLQLTQPDVYIVTVSKTLEWMRNPLTLSQLKDNDIFACPVETNPAPCSPVVCSYSASEPGGSRSMRSCVPCPPVYPWLDNPYGNN